MPDRATGDLAGDLLPDALDLTPGELRALTGDFMGVFAGDLAGDCLLTDPISDRSPLRTIPILSELPLGVPRCFDPDRAGLEPDLPGEAALPEDLPGEAALPEDLPGEARRSLDPDAKIAKSAGDILAC